AGGIVVSLDEKSGRFLPKEVRARALTMQWLMFQMSQVGPMIGQAGHFVNQAPERIPYAIQRFIGESVRILGVLETALHDKEHLAGDYSIADIATYPWVAAAWAPLEATLPDEIGKLAGVKQWLDRMAARPAVQRGVAGPAGSRRSGEMAGEGRGADLPPPPRGDSQCVTTRGAAGPLPARAMEFGSLRLSRRPLQRPTCLDCPCSVRVLGEAPPSGGVERARGTMVGGALEASARKPARRSGGFGQVALVDDVV